MFLFNFPAIFNNNYIKRICKYLINCYTLWRSTAIKSVYLGLILSAISHTLIKIGMRSERQCVLSAIKTWGVPVGQWPLPNFLAPLHPIYPISALRWWSEDGRWLERDKNWPKLGRCASDRASIHYSYDHRPTAIKLWFAVLSDQFESVDLTVTLLN